MKKIFTLIAILFLAFTNSANAQCVSTTLFASGTISSSVPGTSLQVTTCNWGGEYDNITFNATGAFTFSSNIATDYITVTDVSNNILAFGFTPLATAIPSVGVYRMHIAASGPTVCLVQNSCRVTSIFVPLSACAGMPVAGSVPASFSICPNTTAALTTTGTTAASGLVYQWLQSPNGLTGWTPVVGGSGANTTSLTTPSLTVLTYYMMTVTCTVSAQTASTTVLSVNPNLPTSLCYCNLNLGGSGCGSDYIDNVSILSTPINNNSMCNNNVTNGTYTYFSPGASTTGTLMAGATYTIGVKTTANNIESLWIDYDQSGTYDPSEHTQITFTSTPGIYSTASFMVPIAALSGPTGMRVRSRGAGNPNGSTDACTTFGSGETEDYVVTISPAVGCSGTPNAGTTTASSTLACSGSSVNLSLSGSTIAGGLTYQWYSSPNGITWTSVPTATNISTTQTIIATVYYQCIVACGSNTSASTPIQITMFSGPVAGNISGPTTVTVNTINSYTVSPAAGNIQWYQGTSSTGPWTAIANATTAASAFNSTPSGVVYYIAVASSAGCSSATTAVAYSVTVVPAPGDDVCSAITLTLGPSSVKYPFAGFGVQPGEVAPGSGSCNSNIVWCTSTLENTRWFKFVAPASGHVTVQSPDMDTQIAIWKAVACGNLLTASNNTLISANDDDINYTANGGVLFSSYTHAACLTPGSTYYIQLDTYSAAAPGDSTRLVVLDAGTPLNASFSGLASAYCVGAPSSSLVPAVPGGELTLNTSTVSITSFTPNTAGTFTVTYQAYGCFSSSVTVVSVCTGIDPIVANASGVNIFPNPNNGYINVTLNENATNSVIEIYDALGKLVVLKTLSTTQTTINTTELNQGMYTYRIRNNEGVINRGKLIKE